MQITSSSHVLTHHHCPTLYHSNTFHLPHSLSFPPFSTPPPPPHSLTFPLHPYPWLYPSLPLPYLTLPLNPSLTHRRCPLESQGSKHTHHRAAHLTHDTQRQSVSTHTHRTHTYISLSAVSSDIVHCHCHPVLWKSPLNNFSFCVDIQYMNSALFYLISPTQMTPHQSFPLITSNTQRLRVCSHPVHRLGRPFLRSETRRHLRAESSSGTKNEGKYVCTWTCVNLSMQFIIGLTRTFFKFHPHSFVFLYLSVFSADGKAGETICHRLLGRGTVEQCSAMDILNTIQIMREHRNVWIAFSFHLRRPVITP